MELIVNASKSRLYKKWTVQVLEGRKNVEDKILWNGVSEEVQTVVTPKITEYLVEYHSMPTTPGKETNDASWKLTLKKNELVDFIVASLS